MSKIEIKEYLNAVTTRADQFCMFLSGSNLSTIERAMCEANVFFLNKIIEEINALKSIKLTNEQIKNPGAVQSLNNCPGSDMP